MSLPSRLTSTGFLNWRRQHRMNSSARPALFTTVDCASPLTTRPDSTYKSGKVVQTSGATSVNQMKNIFIAGVFILITGCVAQPVKKDMRAFIAAAPRSILVVPVVNKSLDVDAPIYVLAAVPVPIAEKGYYVFPVNTTKFVLEQEGFYEEKWLRLFEQNSPIYKWNPSGLVWAKRSQC